MKNTDGAVSDGMPETLDQALIGQPLVIQQVQVHRAAPEWASWLEEIGFIAGEQVALMARALPGGDPLVVRVGQSTFALRRAEAACVRVIPLTPKVPAFTAGFADLVGEKA